jgi:hypothetical protein
MSKAASQLGGEGLLFNQNEREPNDFIVWFFMEKIVCVELKDGMGFDSGFVSPASYTCMMYYRLPENWLDGEALLSDKKEAMLQEMYGRTWRMGNGDGSYYAVFSFVERVLSAQEEEERPWLQNQSAPAGFRYWYYHISEDGQFTKVTRDEF